MLRHLYEKGSGEDWLQLAWMRVRVTSSEEYEVQLPEVSCRLDELVRLPQDPPNCASYESTHDMHPSSANDAHSTSAQNVEGSDEIYRDAFQRIRNWLLGKSMGGGDPWPAAAPSMQECDWAILLDLFSSTDVPISKLATLLAQLAPCIGLLEQLWQRGDLVVALLQHHLEQHHDVDALLTSWMDCDWILKVPAKDFRASVRHMKLRDHLGEAVGSRLETDMIRVFHLQRGVHAKRQ
ncbi:hypothetical protein DYB25_009132 [Aphanomyces astaci]|uniref:Uncharacterized protein n=1 Tax=Aphanomyces astaci TaxID=112090 RepID=A0A397BK80_APHAT|nr:hypothetical protein DYB25_009132 [Aphanomyces astaci]